MRMSIGRPSAAMVIACCALAASVGGTAYAEKADKQVTSKDIKDGTIKGKDGKAEALSGKQIKEGTLGQVPSAASADTASVADNAATADSADTATTADNATTADSAGDSDTVGGKTAEDLDTRWLLINESGQIEAQSGGFGIVNCYQANANCYIDASDDVTNNAITASVAVNNVDGSPTFSGQIGVGACGLTSINCAPPNTETTDVLVVTPRDSAGAVPGGVTPPAPADATRFYVEISGAEAVPAP